MKKAKIVSIICYSFVLIITLSMAFRFIFASEFFPYHAAASGTQWASVDPGLQTVIMALFKVCGAGFLLSAMTMMLLIIVPFAKMDQRWSYYAIPSCGLVFWLVIFATTLYVSVITPAKAPWTGSLICIILILTGFVFSLFSRK